jgi:Mlc titration factor MtfA (ptsG expression regulator)
MRGGVTAGVDTADPTTERGRWLARAGRRDEHSPSGSTTTRRRSSTPNAREALEEFFAVGSEAFFVAPEDLEREEPELYRLLAEFFRQEPARDKRNGAARPPSTRAKRG